MIGNPRVGTHMICTHGIGNPWMTNHGVTNHRWAGTGACPYGRVVRNVCTLPSVPRVSTTCSPHLCGMPGE
ncbi:hypothetical protein [Desulforhabdus sp. TSK]|uniref:hypothetical protein n=1 Tax=Desulforhabdus sp. TSK TaxID=2925014 RepID=UPI001FC8251C|nr:hypothetical protein [Desulforhabdus sp. TSK]GKT06732.1 hypothetical protein DSTSK_00370 [Desulforhabdus sp. TSK]